MIPYEQHKVQIQALIGDEDSRTATEILLFSNIAYRDIASSHLWQPLMVEAAFSSLILPGDLERIAYVEPDDTDYSAFLIDRTDQYFSSRLYNWWRNLTTTTPLVTGSDGVVVANSTKFTSASPSTAFTADHVGEYIRIGSNLGIYRIDAFVSGTEITLEKGFRGVGATGQNYELRPNGTQQVALTDQQGSDLGFTDWRYIYQKIPLPLYNDYDQIELPGSCQAVTVMVHQMMLLREKYDNDALKRSQAFQDALGLMQPLNPTKGRHTRPRMRTGEVLRFGKYKSTPYYNQNDRRVLGI